MSFGSTPDIASDRKIANVDPAQVNTVQQGPPVAYLLGRRLVSPTWFTPFYNQITEDVTSQAGKGADSQVTGHIYYGDIAGVLFVGGRQPGDAIFRILSDTDEVWAGSVYRDSSPYEIITVPDFGTLKIQWGTTDQPFDTTVLAPLGPRPTVPGFDPRDPTTPGWPVPYLGGHFDNHPPYRYWCSVIAKHWKTGQDRTQMTNLQFEMMRSAPWFAASSVDRVATGLDSNAAGVNPIGMLYDILTDPVFGFGLPDARLNMASFEAALLAIPAGFRISPLITSQLDRTAVIAQLLEYFDGYLRLSGGLLEAGVYQHGNIDLDAVPELTSADWLTQPKFSPASYNGTTNVTTVVGPDRTNNFVDDPQDYKDQENRRKIGQQRTELLQRPWITDSALRKAYAIEYGHMHAQPVLPGSGTAKRERLKALALKSGSLVKVDSAALGYQVLCRISKIKRPNDRGAGADLQFEAERGYWPEIYHEPPAPSDHGFTVRPGAITNFRIRELPSGLTTSGQTQITVFGQRPGPSNTLFHVHLSVDQVDYAYCPPPQIFCAFGKVAVAYIAGTADLDVTIGLILDLYGLDISVCQTQSNAQRDANTLLLFVDNEIMSVGQVTAIGGGPPGTTRVRIFLARKRYGTAKTIHYVDANVWVQFRARLQPIAHPLFQGTRYFKLQAFTANQGFDIADAAAIPYTFGLVNPVGAPDDLTLRAFIYVTPKGDQQSRIYASWESAGPSLSISGYEAQYKPTLENDGSWVSTGTLPPTLDANGRCFANLLVIPGRLYDVKVRAINSYGRPGEFCLTLTILSLATTPFRVTGLEIEGQGNDNVSRTADFNFVWRLNSPSHVQPLGLEGGYKLAGAGPPPVTVGPESIASPAHYVAEGAMSPGMQDPTFDFYQVVIYSMPDRVQRRIFNHITEPHFNFSIALNRGTTGGVHSYLRVFVRAVDSLGVPSPFAWGDFINQPPAAPTLPTLNSSFGAVHIGWTNSADIDLAAVQVLQSTTNYAGAAVRVTIPIPAQHPANSHADISGFPSGPTRYYFWLKSVDSFDLKSTAAVYVGSATPGIVTDDDIESFRDNGAVAAQPNGGTFSGTTPITLTCPVAASAQIYYRFDNVTPTTADSLYNPAAKPNAAAGNFSARAYLNGEYGPALHIAFNTSGTTVLTPTFDDPPGTYLTEDGTRDIPASCGTAGAITRYTSAPYNTTPATPTGSSPALIGGVFTAFNDRNYKLKSFKAGLTDSDFALGHFRINQSGGSGGGGGGPPEP
jgi:hypothetical protein